MFEREWHFNHLRGLYVLSPSRARQGQREGRPRLSASIEQQRAAWGSTGLGSKITHLERQPQICSHSRWIPASKASRSDKVPSGESVRELGLLLRRGQRGLDQKWWHYDASTCMNLANNPEREGLPAETLGEGGAAATALALATATTATTASSTLAVVGLAVF